jgi:hypothetical protein
MPDPKTLEEQMKRYQEYLDQKDMTPSLVPPKQETIVPEPSAFSAPKTLEDQMKIFQEYQARKGITQVKPPVTAPSTRGAAPRGMPDITPIWRQALPMPTPGPTGTAPPTLPFDSNIDPTVMPPLRGDEGIGGSIQLRTQREREGFRPDIDYKSYFDDLFSRADPDSFFGQTGIAGQIEETALDIIPEAITKPIFSLAEDAFIKPGESVIEGLVESFTYPFQGKTPLQSGYNERIKRFNERPWWAQLGLGLFLDPTGSPGRIAKGAKALGGALDGLVRPARGMSDLERIIQTTPPASEFPINPFVGDVGTGVAKEPIIGPVLEGMQPTRSGGMGPGVEFVPRISPGFTPDVIPTPDRMLTAPPPQSPMEAFTRIQEETPGIGPQRPTARPHEGRVLPPTDPFTGQPRQLLVITRENPAGDIVSFDNTRDTRRFLGDPARESDEGRRILEITASARERANAAEEVTAPRRGDPDRRRGSTTVDIGELQEELRRIEDLHKSLSTQKRRRQTVDERRQLIERRNSIRRQIKNTQEFATQLGGKFSSRARLAEQESLWNEQSRSVFDVPERPELPGVISSRPMPISFVGETKLGPTSGMPPDPMIPGVRQAGIQLPEMMRGRKIDPSTPEEAARLRQEVREGADPQAVEDLGVAPSRPFVRQRVESRYDDPGNVDVPSGTFTSAEEASALRISSGQAEADDIIKLSLEKAEGNVPASPPKSDATPSVDDSGKVLLQDPQDFQTQMDISFNPDVFRRIGNMLGGISFKGINVGKAAGILRIANPTVAVQTPIGRAGLTRSALLDEGRIAVSKMMSYANRVGDQQTLFGRTDPTTGLIRSGKFAGHSVNEIAENPSKFNLSSRERDWIDRTNEMEDAILDLYKRNDIPIDEVPFDDIERFAGRIHVGKKDKLDNITAITHAGGGRIKVIGRPTGSEKSRGFTTVKEAQDAGYIPLNYEQSLRVRATAAWQRVVDKRTTDWIFDNLPDDVKLKRTSTSKPISFNEDQISRIAASDVLEGNPATIEEMQKDLTALLADDYVPKQLSWLRHVTAYNSVQRIFALAGDASLFTIQLLPITSRHPFIFGRTGAAFGAQLARGMFNPKTARKASAELIDDNRALLQRHRTMLTSSNTTEFTEALAPGGILSPGQIGGPVGSFPEAISTIKGTVKTIATAPLRPFQGAFEYAMDTAGVHLAKSLDHLGTDAVKLSQVDDYINNMRGLTSSSRIGVSATQRSVESALLLAPRYRRATAALHASVLQGGLRGKLVRRAYAHMAVGMTFLFAGTTITLGIMQGKSSAAIKRELADGLNPQSKRFMLWRIGTQFVGPGSKYVSDLRLISKIIDDPGNAPGIIKRWMRGQGGALPSDAWDILSGVDYMGDPVRGDWDEPSTYVDIGEVFGENFIFLWLKSALFEGGTIDERVLRGTSEFLGLRSYPEHQHDIALENYRSDLHAAGITWGGLTDNQKKGALATLPWDIQVKLKEEGKEWAERRFGKTLSKAEKLKAQAEALSGR